MLNFAEVRRRLANKERLLAKHLKDKEEVIKWEPREVAIKQWELEKKEIENDVKDLEALFNWCLLGGDQRAELGLSEEKYKRLQRIKKSYCPQKGCLLENNHEGNHKKINEK